MNLKINGPIVSNDDKWIYEIFDIEAFSPRDLDNYLDNITSGEEIDIEINSPGGYVTAGSEIYTALMQHKGPVNILITGVAASMASVIAMAGTTVTMSPTAQIMIHNVSAYGSGDYRDFAHISETLKKLNKSIMNAYQIKTGKNEKEILELMDKETWMEANEAKNQGFVDKILQKEYQLEMVASYGDDFLIDKNIIKSFKKERELLNLLELKGDVKWI